MYSFYLNRIYHYTEIGKGITEIEYIISSSEGHIKLSFSYIGSSIMKKNIFTRHQLFNKFINLTLDFTQGYCFVSSLQYTTVSHGFLMNLNEEEVKEFGKEIKSRIKKHNKQRSFKIELCQIPLIMKNIVRIYEEGKIM